MALDRYEFGLNRPVSNKLARCATEQEQIGFYEISIDAIDAQGARGYRGD